ACDSAGRDACGDPCLGLSVAKRRAPMVAASRLILAFLASILAVGATMGDARADAIPPPTELPPGLTLDDALRLFRTRGLDVLIAEASIRSAEGAVSVAGASPNPVGSVSWGRAFAPIDPSCDGCSANYWAAGLSDSAAIEDIISGKKDLRLKVARN